MNKKIQLGDRVKDIITGITGIAVATTKWTFGCDRITVQPEGCDEKKEPFPAFSVDEPQLKLVKANVLKLRPIKKTTKKVTGGGGITAGFQVKKMVTRH